MAEKRDYQDAAICAALIGIGAVAGFVAAIILFRVLGTHGNDEAPGAGIFLLVAWMILIPVGSLAGIAGAKFLWKRRHKRVVEV